MSHAELESLLKQAMGLDAASIGSSTVERAVMGRMLLCELNDVGAYLNRVRVSSAELQALIEAVIVPETWFFRDREAFAELTRVVYEEWLAGNPEGTLRLLSVPCSSGEEPYSMAMALLDAGMAPKRYRIDAVDISALGICSAQIGLYGKNSFRGAQLEFRDRHFEPTAFGARLSSQAREAVRFQQGNLLADEFLPGAEIYHIIFCRNLLIYFDREAQDRAVKVLERLLKPEGALFVGPSESGLLLSHGFVSCKAPLAFAFRRTSDSAGPKRVSAVRSAAPPSEANPDAKRRNPAARESVDRKPLARKPVTVELSDAREEALAQALRLADLGHLAEAARACDEHLRKYGPSVACFYLLGVIRAAAGNLSEAREYYRKALYLDPGHHDALAHLGLLLEKQGDAVGARMVNERLRRLVNRRLADE